MELQQQEHDQWCSKVQITITQWPPDALMRTEGEMVVEGTEKLASVQATAALC